MPGCFVKASVAKSPAILLAPSTGDNNRSKYTCYDPPAAVPRPHSPFLPLSADRSYTHRQSRGLSFGEVIRIKPLQTILLERHYLDACSARAVTSANSSEVSSYSITSRPKSERSLIFSTSIYHAYPERCSQHRPVIEILSQGLIKQGQFWSELRKPQHENNLSDEDSGQNARYPG